MSHWYEIFSTGQTPGAGSYECLRCGKVVQLDDDEQLPRCPHCKQQSFSRNTDPPPTTSFLLCL